MSTVLLSPGPRLIEETLTIVGVGDGATVAVGVGVGTAVAVGVAVGVGVGVGVGKELSINVVSESATAGTPLKAPDAGNTPPIGTTAATVSPSLTTTWPAGGLVGGAVMP